MKILNISNDKLVLNKNSSVARRIIEYGELVNRYYVIVPANKDKEIILSDKVTIYSTGVGNKFLKIVKLYNLGKKILKQEKINVITVQDQYYFALIAWLLAKKLNIGLEIQVHGFEKYSGARKIIAKFVLPKADSIRTVSQRLKRRLINEFGVEKDKIFVIPIYVDIKTQSPKLKAQNDGKFIFLTIGRLVPVKNIAMQIGAMQNIVKKHPNTELWIVGDGPERENLITEAGDNKFIRFLGWQSDVEKFYKLADAFMLTSNSEGWPLVIIEAASFSLPIIMTDMGSAGEFIKDGENGLVILLNNQKKLEESMIRLIKNSELRKKLGENARRAVLNLPSKEEIFNLYKKSWQTALIL